MSDVVYDLPISEVAKILEKSDRQVRRYVKEKRLKARPVRVDGHIKLMFNEEQVQAYKERLARPEFMGESGREVVADTRLVDDVDDTEDRDDDLSADDSDISDSGTVKYVLDALKEQITDLRMENKDLHYQLEQRSGQVGFLQGRVETLQEELKMLMPAQPNPPEANGDRKSWFRRIFSRG